MGQEEDDDGWLKELVKVGFHGFFWNLILIMRRNECGV